MFKRKRDGFTLLELLVVIAIIAILASLALPAIVKARRQASINKAMAEMTGFTSTESSIYMDLKSTGYVPLCDLVIPQYQSGGTTNITLSGSNFINATVMVPPITLLKILSGPTQASGYAPGYFTNTSDFTDPAAPMGNFWNGPYATFQPKATLSTSGVTVGNYPVVTGTSWITGTNPITSCFPDGTPLDPWGHPYGMAWNSTEQVMVIYSAGPDGKFGTNPGDTTIATAVPTAGSDDLLYKFR